jgi:hypothetical protein
MYDGNLHIVDPAGRVEPACQTDARTLSVGPGQHRHFVIQSAVLSLNDIQVLPVL